MFMVIVLKKYKCVDIKVKTDITSICVNNTCNM